MLSSIATVSTTLGTSPTGTVASAAVLPHGLSQSAPPSPAHILKDQNLVHKREPADYGRGGAGFITQALTSCFGSVFPFFNRRPTDSIVSMGDDWEIPFESISNLEWLGAGSQGAVFKGRLNGEVVAVKKVKELKDTETKNLRHLEHKNIIKFMGVCTQSPCFCIVMEFCPAGQLNELLRKPQPLSYQSWVSTAKQIASGMEYLHRNKIVHRDLKSPNILVGTDGTMKISDFGTSQVWTGEANDMMSFVGTVCWMAPEIIKKEACSEKVDIWSFGVVLWEMITCEQPYKGIDSMAVLWAVGSNKLSLPLPANPPLPCGLLLLIQQCWSQKPRNRPSFKNILQHLDILEKELKNWGEQTWNERYNAWRLEASNIKYPETLQGHPSDLRMMDAQEQKRKRNEELRHAQDIRVMYESKFKRCNKMYQKLTSLLEEIEIREKELCARERVLTLRENQSYRAGSFSGVSGHVVVRAGPKSRVGDAQQDVFSTAVAHPSFYGSYQMSSSDDEQMPYFARDSPIRGSRDSGSISFSRQSSARSSSGVARNYRLSPSRVHNSPKPRDAMFRQSVSSHCGEFLRHTATRNSGLSEDSGIQVAPSRVSSCNALADGSSAISMIRNGEGRWSDGSAKRRLRRSRESFMRDSPARVPHGRQVRDKDKRQSCPVNSADIVQISDTQRAASIAPSVSYEEALSTFGSQSTFEPMGYDNPLCVSPASNCEPDNATTAPETGILRLGANVELTSSVDSNNAAPPHKGCSDASGESSSEEDAANGNSRCLFDSSLEAPPSENEKANDRRRLERLMESSTSMASSLERSLELGAYHSDGLSDRERALRCVQRTIKTHRRTHSGGQPVHMTVVDETSTESDESEAVAC